MLILLLFFNHLLKDEDVLLHMTESVEQLDVLPENDNKKGTAVLSCKNVVTLLYNLQYIQKFCIFVCLLICYFVQYTTFHLQSWLEKHIFNSDINNFPCTVL